MHPDRQDGFTLVEVLVALVVISLLLGIAMNAALQAKARAVDARTKEGAVMLAAALIEERRATPFSTARSTGESGDLRWRASEDVLAAGPRGLFVLTLISVVVEDDDEVTLAALSTRKLKARPQ